MWAVMRGVGPGILALDAPLVILAALVALVVVAVVAIVVLSPRTSRSFPHRRGARGWASTPGTILTTTIQVRRTGTARCEVPVVRYAYRVGQDAFQGSRIRAADESGALSSTRHARNVLARYPVGASVVVWYDPTDPTESALEP